VQTAALVSIAAALLDDLVQRHLFKGPQATCPRFKSTVMVDKHETVLALLQNEGSPFFLGEAVKTHATTTAGPIE